MTMDTEMDYQQRFAEAFAYHQAALRRVAETPPPAGQRFAPGARVHISDDLGPHMSHFPAGKLATVRYTYAHAYGATDKRSLTQYCLDIDGCKRELEGDDDDGMGEM